MMATHPTGPVGQGDGKDRVSQVLRDMRYVYMTKSDEGRKERSEGSRKVREFYREDPKGFLAKLMMLEAAHRAARVREKELAAEVKKPGPDEGVVRVQELIAKLLAEWKE